MYIVFPHILSVFGDILLNASESTAKMIGRCVLWQLGKL